MLRFVVCLTQIPLFCLNTPSSFIWMWWKSSGRGRTGTVRAAAPPHIPHTNFYESEVLSGNCSGFLTSIFPFRPCMLDAQEFPRHSPRGEVVAGPWKKPFGQRRQQQHETSWVHFKNESIIRNYFFFCWVIKMSVEKKQGWFHHVLSNLKFSVESKCIWPLPSDSKHRGVSAVPEASIAFGFLCVTPCEVPWALGCCFCQQEQIASSNKHPTKLCMFFKKSTKIFC